MILYSGYQNAKAYTSTVIYLNNVLTQTRKSIVLQVQYGKIFMCANLLVLHRDSEVNIIHNASSRNQVQYQSVAMDDLTIFSDQRRERERESISNYSHVIYALPEELLYSVSVFVMWFLHIKMKQRYLCM